METTGLEPATSGLQSRRSPSWATSPGTLDLLFMIYYLLIRLTLVDATIINHKYQIVNPKWARVDSNYRPHAYQACALTNWATSPRQFSISDLRLTILIKKSQIGNRKPTILPGSSVINIYLKKSNKKTAARNCQRPKIRTSTIVRQQFRAN